MERRRHHLKDKWRLHYLNARYWIFEMYILFCNTDKIFILISQSSHVWQLSQDEITHIFFKFWVFPDKCLLLYLLWLCGMIEKYELSFHNLSNIMTGGRLWLVREQHRQPRQVHQQRRGVPGEMQAQRWVRVVHTFRHPVLSPVRVWTLRDVSFTSVGSGD